MRCQYALVLSAVSNDVMGCREQNASIRMILFCFYLSIYIYIYIYIEAVGTHTITTITCLPRRLCLLSFFLVSFFSLVLPHIHYVTTNSSHSCQSVCTCRVENIGSSFHFFFLFSSILRKKLLYTDRPL